ANVLLSLFTLLFLIVVAFIGFDDVYITIFVPVVTSGVVGIISLQAACALAIIVYFRFIDRSHGLSIWSTFIAPGLGFVGLMTAVYLTVTNFGFLSGQSLAVNIALLSWVPLLFIVGVG